jgi:hypothetical protein
MILNPTRMRTGTSTALSSMTQIKATRVKMTRATMDNLPFLSQQQQQQPGLDEAEEHPHQQQQWPSRPKSETTLDYLKSNPMAILLIGVIVGALLMNMRPVVIKSV